MQVCNRETERWDGETGSVVRLRVESATELDPEGKEKGGEIERSHTY